MTYLSQCYVISIWTNDLNLQNIYFSCSVRLLLDDGDYNNVIVLAFVDFSRVRAIAYIQPLWTATDSSRHPLFAAISMEFCC
jgi:hypothetical protein